MVGYVEELKKGLFSLRKSELTGLLNRMAGKYQSKIPASLSSQFPDRVNKQDAVDKYREKQELQGTGFLRSIFCFLSFCFRKY